MKEKSVSTGYLEAEEKVSVSERLAEGQPARGTFAIKRELLALHCKFQILLNY